MIVLFIVLLPSGSKHWWGWLVHGVYLLLTGLFFYEAFSRKSYEQIHAQYPSLNRATWVLNWLIFFAIPMLLVWLFLGLPAVWRVLRG
ncbi:MAG: hypothetical protein HY046_03615 [Acidobacteria bacterium]|nr:hypothetical protein [Acidobacteriota bacterium]